MPLLVGAEPFRHDAGPLGVLLLHGFTGCPQSLRPWAEYLAAAGLSVRLPLLPGHGTKWQDLQSATWKDWYAASERDFDELRDRCDEVFVMGLSAGAALGLRLAEVRPEEVAGLVVVNPCVLLTDRRLALLPILKWIVPSFPGVISDINRPGSEEVGYRRVPLRALASALSFWSSVRADLGRVRAPVLVYRSRTDHVVPAASSSAVLAGVGSAEVEERIMEDSYHVATLDHDASTIFAGSLRFVQAHARTTRRGLTHDHRDA